jgi:trehalose/maltose hydrolase-like predicted phosphorylase
MVSVRSVSSTGFSHSLSLEKLQDIEERKRYWGGATLSELIIDPAWVLVEEGFTLAREHEVESLFAIANGYVGNRGSLAEGSPLSAPATFLAGVFEVTKAGAVPGLLLLPDWTGVRAWIEGHPLSLAHGKLLEHRRILDMRSALLWREWQHSDINGRISRISSMRLASLADRHLLVHTIVFTPENYSGSVQLETSIELAPNVIGSPLPEDWVTRRSATRPNILPLGLRSPGTDITVAIAAISQLLCRNHDAGHREIEITERRVTERFSLDVEIGNEYRLDRLVCVYTSREATCPSEEAILHANRAMSAGIRHAVADHERSWIDRWRAADVQVEGDEFLQKALRFAEYHMISAANSEDERVSIGARALTGEAYKGHVFWDTEIYMLPFYSFTHPASGRALLMYRYHTLPAAREKARGAGYRGAMYPWESADTGEETTPTFVIGPDGKVIAVHNGDMEIHITADVAYAVWQYWQVTGDDEFFRTAGAEILMETARMWASRGQVESDGRYHIRHVIGPDEYHEDVDDSAYTNLMAQWNLRRGAESAKIMLNRWPEQWRQLTSRLGITSEEVQSWSRIADIVFIPFDPGTKLFEQFEGFYQKEAIDLQLYEPRNTAMDVILGHERIQQTNVVKQADVVMAMFLLWDEIPADVREANFRYYEPRTGHGSSLSPSMHSLVAARLGDLTTASAYLKQAAEIDLGNNMGNAAGGVHAAAIGGLWQAVVFGFGGVHPEKNGLAFNPRPLPHWRRLSFPLQYCRTSLTVTIDGNLLIVTVEPGGEPINIEVPGSRVLTSVAGQYKAHRQRGAWTQWRVPSE